MEPNKTIIIRDYTADMVIEDEPDIPPEELEWISACLHHYLLTKQLPHMVDPLAAVEFDNMVEACDAIAKEFAGRLVATIDFDCYEAHIRLECAYIEFCHGEFMETLQQLAITATHISISLPPSSPLFQIDIIMPYFTTLTGDP